MTKEKGVKLLPYSVPNKKEKPKIKSKPLNEEVEHYTLIEGRLK